MRTGCFTILSTVFTILLWNCEIHLAQEIRVDSILGQSQQLTKAFQEMTNVSNLWHNYVYFSTISPMLRIDDGGFDMYDGGNIISVTTSTVSLKAVAYNFSYSDPDFNFVTMAGHPFVALLWINNTLNTTEYFEIQVDGFAEADNIGTISTSTRNVINDTSGFRMEYSYIQIFGSSDPSICEIYFSMVAPQLSSILTQSGRTTFANSVGFLRNIYRIDGNPSNLWMGYVLLSKRRGIAFDSLEINQTMTYLFDALRSNGVQTLVQLPEITSTVPAEIFSLGKSQELENALQQVTNITNLWYNYIYPISPSPTFQLFDGGFDMYDHGNRISIATSNISLILAAYNRLYSFPDFNFVTSAGHPFLALLWIDNSLRTTEYFQIQVFGNAGADGLGNIDTSTENVIGSQGFPKMVYSYFQVSGALLDPTICEVYFSMEAPEWSSILTQSGQAEFGNDTDDLNNTFKITGNPSNVFMGYILLSKIEGIPFDPSEIDLAMTYLFNAIRDNRVEILESLGITLPDIDGDDLKATIPFPLTTPSSTTNACNSNPCQNNGICFLENTFNKRCNCTDNYFGQFCDRSIPKCAKTPTCQNGGWCHDQPSSIFGLGYTCTCPSQYTGYDCENDVDECQNLTICGDNADCNNTKGGYFCICKKGYRLTISNKCVPIVLLPFGPNAGDKTVPEEDDALSDVETLPFSIPFGSSSFFSITTSTNGRVFLSNGALRRRLRASPSNSPFSERAAFLAPFWDDFEPSSSYSSRVYYQAYYNLENYFNESDQEDFIEATERIINHFNLTSFNPAFMYKATWSNVTMHPAWPPFFNHLSTFQLVLQTDGCDTYVMFLYQTEGMQWNTDFRVINNGFIGYTNGAEVKFVEVQGDYRPDIRPQTNGGTINGQYLYKLSENSSSNTKHIARCGCLRWYRKDLTLPPLEANFSLRCPGRFSQVNQPILMQSSLYIFQRFNRQLEYLEEWNRNDFAKIDCFYYFGLTNGPRCCYSSSSAFGIFLAGPFASFYERSQINYKVSFQNDAFLRPLIKASLENDAIPRRQCCRESGSGIYCNLFKSRRPDALFSPIIPAFGTGFGDPHIITLDEVEYTFNGIGEYYMIFAPGVFTYQARLVKVKNENGTLSDATVFSALVLKEPNSGLLRFDMNYSDETGRGVLVSVNGILQNINEVATVVENIALSSNINGTVSAIFIGSMRITVSAKNFILQQSFTVAEDKLKHVSKGLLGYYTGNKEDDFEMRDGMVLDLESLQLTDDILNGTLSQRKLYGFGQSWQVPEVESLFEYHGGEDSYALYNPENPPDPAFLEDLVASQRNTPEFQMKVSSCTGDNGIVSTVCLYDFLLTNNNEVAMETMSNERNAQEIIAANANAIPNITINAQDNFVNGFWLVQVEVSSTLFLTAIDPDSNGLQFSLFSESTILAPTGVTIDPNTGLLSWTPTYANRLDSSSSDTTLIVVVDDGNSGVASVAIPIKLCLCVNNGTCQFNNTINEIPNYQEVGCNCTTGFSGEDCGTVINECEIGICYPNVTCEDLDPPETAECGDCPDGTTGDGFDCVIINLCDSNPCEQICTPFVGVYNCSCEEGYEIDNTNTSRCQDVNECDVQSPCDGISNLRCVNTRGSFRCDCIDGFTKMNSICVDVDECNQTNSDCNQTTSECINTQGSFVCLCRDGFTSINGSACVDIDECENETLDTCIGLHQECINTFGDFECTCRSGYELDSFFNCEDLDECSNSSLNDCNFPNSICHNTEGGYLCTCQAGFTGDGKACDNIDECLVDNPCSPNFDCTDNEGNYTCTCKPQYQAALGTCEEIDICSVNEFEATNSPRSFTTPNWPSNYESLEAPCSSAIRTSSGNSIMIRFSEYNLSPTDTLEVIQDGIVSIEYSGNLTSSPPTFYSYSNRVGLRFTATDASGGKGFSGFYRIYSKQVDTPVLPTPLGPGSWTSWYDDSPCSVTCGKGKLDQRRVCNTSVENNNCSGENVQVRQGNCTFPDCPGWSLWSKCSIACNSGIRNRTRDCNIEDENCVNGIETETQECMDDDCCENQKNIWKNSDCCKFIEKYPKRCKDIRKNCMKACCEIESDMTCTSN